MVEPATLLETEFNLPQGWIEDMRQRHQGFLDARWTRGSSVAFFEMNVGFHSGLAAAAGNRFVSEALHRINSAAACPTTPGGVVAAASSRAAASTWPSSMPSRKASCRWRRA